MTARRNIAYLGPVGTFCHEATLSQKDLSNENLEPKQSIADVFEAVDSGECDLGVVPLENTIEGSVSLTLDMLIFDSEAMIQREIVHPISLCLAAKEGTDENTITSIVSHPHALAQCRSYISEKYPNIKTYAADSTASAAHNVAISKDNDRAVICPIEAAKRNNLTIIDSHIQDYNFNETRFIVIGRDIPAISGDDRTSIVTFQRADKAGSLLAILSEFAKRDISFTKLESRPTKEGLGQYCFIMDFVGHIGQDHIASCLTDVRTSHADIKFLGSYPIATSNGSSSNNLSKVWKDTKDWLQDLQAKIEQ